MSTPAVLPGSIAAARCATSSSANSPPSLGLERLQLSKLPDVGELRRLEQLFGHLAGEVARSCGKLDDEVVNGT